MRLSDIFRRITGRDKVESKPLMLEVGGTGTMFFGGALSDVEEYNPELRGERGLRTVERMRRSDGQVKAALLACELPFRAKQTQWDIQPATESKQDLDIAQFVRYNLFEGMTITWDSLLHHILLMLPFGFSVFEKVWELEDGRYKWRKLAPRLARTIHQWLLDDEGGLAGVVQLAYKAGNYETVTIPVEKLLVFTNEREGSNYQGMSTLRAAYKHWYYKDGLYKLDAIAAERHGVGLAVFRYPSATSKEDKDKISAIGERLHAHERAYVALPIEVEFDLKGVAGQLHDIKGSIEHHDIQIVRSILAQFINLGATDIGSYALSQDQSGFFLMALQAVGANICDTFNRYAIKQLVDYNWDVERYPKLTVSGLEYYDIAKYSKAISDLVNSGLILPDKAIEEELRRRLHLPAVRAPEVAKAREMRLGEWQPARHPRGVERFVAFAEINDKLGDAEDKFVKAAKLIQDRQIRALVDKAINCIEQHDIDAISKLDVPYHKQMSDRLGEVLLDIYKYGRQQVKEELERQKGDIRARDIKLLDPKASEDYLQGRAKASASVLATRLRSAMAWEALHQIKADIVDPEALMGALTDLSDRELIGMAKFSVPEAFGLGRDAQALDMKDSIERVIYSALLDVNTCEACAKVDGKEFPFPSADWDDVTPPYKHCEGHDRCRCVGVYVFKAEKKAI